MIKYLFLIDGILLCNYENGSESADNFSSENCESHCVKFSVTSFHGFVQQAANSLSGKGRFGGSNFSPS